MKTFSKFTLGVSLILILSILQSSPVAISKSNIYSLNKEWKFLVKKTNSTFLDTLYLKIVPNKDNITENVIETGCRWILTGLQSSDNSIVSDTIISYVLQESEIDTDNSIIKIGISPPTNSYLTYTRLLESPFVKLPIHIGYVSKYKVESTSINDERGADKIKSEGAMTVSGKIFYDNPLVKDSCWVLQTMGESDLGMMGAKYYFHEKFGFVYFYYDFNKYQVEISLSDFKPSE